MTLSVYGRKTHEVLILTYLIVIVWLMAPVLVMIAHQVLVGGRGLLGGGDGSVGDPVRVGRGVEPLLPDLRAYSSPGKVGVGTFVGFLAGCLLGSAALTGLATARVRGVALSQAGRPASRAGWRLPKLPRLEWLRSRVGPSLDGNPVAWREWHRARPSPMMRGRLGHSTRPWGCSGSGWRAGPERSRGQ